MKRAIVDVDGTLWDLSTPLHVKLREQYPHIPKDVDNSSWEWYEPYITKKQFYKVVDETHIEQLYASAYSGSQRLFHELHVRKYEVFVASHRRYDTGPQLAFWLWMQWLVPYSALYCGWDKTEFIRPFDLVIDDAPSTIDFALGQGCRVMYLNWPWNKEQGGEKYDTLVELVENL